MANPKEILKNAKHEHFAQLVSNGEMEDGLNLPSFGYYTYVLIDPRDGKVFYVGKGKGRRLYTHVRDAINGRVLNVEKHKRIVDVRQSGKKVIERVCSVHQYEIDAFKAERLLISKLKEHGLTNAVRGTINHNERIAQRSIWNLNRMKPFDKWIKSLTKHQIEVANIACGSPEEFYYYIKLNFLKILKASRC